MHRTQSQRLIGYLLVAAAACLWGTLGIVGRTLYEGGVSPGVAVTVRNTGAAVLLLLLVGALRPQWLRVALRDIPYFAAYGLVSVAAFNLLYFHTVQRIPVAAAAVLLYTAPAFVAVAAYFLFGERFTRHKVAALALTLLGCALVARAYEPAVFQGQGLGLLTGLGAGFTYGMYSIFGKHGLKRYNPWTVLTYSLLPGSAVLLALYGRETVRAVLEAPQLLPAMAYMSLVPTLGSYGLYLVGLRYIESSHASLVATVEPVVAAALGFLLLAEPLSLPQVAGAGLVLGGAALLQRDTVRNDETRLAG